MRPLPVLLLSALSYCVSAADYHEKLNLRPLPLSALLASFNFRSNSTLHDFESQNFGYFPRSLGQILQHAGTKELHLRFSLGRWDAESWGARPWEGQREGGTGVELWAWLDARSDEEADEKWLILTNALSGRFAPPSTLSMSHELPGLSCLSNQRATTRGTPSRIFGCYMVCCHAKSMAIDVRPLCPKNGECVLEIEQTIDMVLDVERSKRPQGNPIPRPPPSQDLKCDASKPYHADNTCFPISHASGQEWHLSHIFGRPITGTCPLADPESAPVCIEVPASRSVYTSGGVYETKNPNGVSRCFTFDVNGEFDIILPALDAEATAIAPAELVDAPTPLIYAERSLMGYGQERGGVQAILTNPSPDTEVEFIYMESLPWFMRVYLHTLETRINGNINQQASIIEQVFYRPAIDRARGTQLELRMRIPPDSTVFLTYEFEKTILRYTEYPPDANRGFDVAAAVITTISPRVQSVRTTTLLLNLPVPDFSMPYNVIIFTSTAIALAFGGLYNILVRRLVAADEAPSPLARAKLGKLLARFRSRNAAA
ncbi:GPI transamidase component GPI16 like protein [Verticillium longisporum]|nr:GPI transamidase component GPI16 like protein [Verticillium longisporum]